MDVDSVDESHHGPSQALQPPKRNQTACEACRATKIRCQPSDQPGVCRKCLDSKRECVSRTGPRTRRPRRSKLSRDGAPQQPQAPPPNAPSSTFSINFSVPTPPEADDSFDTLRESHEQFFDTLLETGEDTNGSTFASSASSLPTPSASSATSQSIEDLHGKPQFNLASAESLLGSFRAMMPHFPCIVLPPDVTVPQLAATKPFVLLAILAAASGSKTLQGHSLYDEEFRKVLGLKFVARGERSLELLQGILIYCAWYPFHLRPKNKQIFHYIRMAADLVHDLEMDQEPQDGPMFGTHVTEQQLDNIRGYLGFCYTVAAFILGWGKYRNLAANFTPWTLRCCEVLERHAQVDGDTTLAILVQLSSIAKDASEAIHDGRGQTEQHSRLVLLGLETQAREVRGRIPSRIAETTPVKLATLFVDFYLDAGSLLVLPRPRNPSMYSHFPSVPTTAAKLTMCVPILKMFLSEILRLEPQTFAAFAAVDWTRLILSIILSFRLSFALPDLPSFDHLWAREELRIGDFLENLRREPELALAGKKVDVLSASRVVMRVAKAKFDRRVELERTKAAASGSQGCPMLDGSLEQYLPLWDAELNMSMTNITGVGGKKPVFHDLWATMTMGWAHENLNNDA